MATKLTDSVIEVLAEWVRERRVFRRNKVPIEMKVMAEVLCASGLSYREVAEVMGDISHIAVRDAHVAFANALPKPERKYRRCVSLEESHEKINNRKTYVWLARDVDNKEVLAYGSSFTASPEDGEKFLERVLQYCSNRPLVRVGRGARYPHTFRSLDLQFQIETTPSIRDRIGKWFWGLG